MAQSPNPGSLLHGSNAAESSRPRAAQAREAPTGTLRPSIRVCLVGPSLDILGGQAVQLDRLLQKLRQTEGIEVGFIAMNPRLPGPFRVLQRVKYVRTVVTEIAYVLSLLRRLREYDVVHVFSPSYWAFLLGPVPALAIGRMLGRSTLLNYHSGEADDHLSRWPMTVRLTRLADHIAVPSGYLTDVFARHGLAAESIPNFVDVDAIPHRQRTVLRPRFLSNRNLEPMYNVACSIRAFGHVQRAVPEASLVVAGYGSQRAMLESLAGELGLRNVRFTGRVPPQEMGRLLDEADVLLNSPDIDNMPLSLIEAQAAGLPIASTSTGGIPYIVRHEESGLLVPPGDDEALGAAALRLLQEPELAARLSSAGRLTCLSTCTWDTVGVAWVRRYNELAARVASRNRPSTA